MTTAVPRSNIISKWFYKTKYFWIASLKTFAELEEDSPELHCNYEKRRRLAGWF